MRAVRSLCTRLRAFPILLVVLAALAAGCSGDESKDSFEQEVVAARDTADSALANIRQPKSTDDLILRLRAGRDELANASGAIAVADAPEDLTEERRRFANALSDMSKEMDAAANSIELVQGEPGAESEVRSIIFDTWDTVQAALMALQDEGIDVQPLGRHGGAES
jgi:hypothetical protein